MYQVLEEAQAKTIKVMIVVKLKERQHAKHFPFLTVFFSKAESTFMLTNKNLIGWIKMLVSHIPDVRHANPVMQAQLIF